MNGLDQIFHILNPGRFTYFLQRAIGGPIVATFFKCLSYVQSKSNLIVEINF